MHSLLYACVYSMLSVSACGLVQLSHSFSSLLSSAILVSTCVSVTMSARLLHEDSSLSETTPPPPVIPRRFYWSPRMMCLTTKPVIVILLWVFVVACVLRGIQYTSVFFASHSAILKTNQQNSFLVMLSCYAFINIIAISYPIGGFLADVYCGRYKVVTISLVFIWVALLLLGVAIVTVPFTEGHQDNIKYALEKFMYVFFTLSFVVVIPGLSGFYSNVVQLSLDQLRDAPSHTLGIFQHWFVWMDLLGEGVVFVVYVLLSCSLNSTEDIMKNAGYVLTCVLFILLSILLVLNCFTRRWFYAADIHYNPFEVLVNVLKYVRTHKYPTRHSALHWTNGEQPSRFDFAKECYGGPFTSSQVEDVKALGRVVLVLLAVGPVFVLCVPTSYLIYPTVCTSYCWHQDHICSPESVLIKSGSLSYLLSFDFSPSHNLGGVLCVKE